MITSIANNFGCGPIQMKDFQSDNMIILNAKFTIDPTHEAYKECDVLEIKVPDLKIGSSSETFCYIGSHELMWPGTSYTKDFKIITAIKTWIKDRNTICIEKFSHYDDLNDITIWLCGMYPVVGRRGELKLYDRTPVQYKALQTNLSASNLACVVEEGWCFLHFHYSNAYGVNEKTPIEAELVGFPTDVDFEFPMVGGGQQSTHGGCLYCDCTIKDGVLLLPEPKGSMGNTAANPFVMFYAVRG